MRNFLVRRSVRRLMAVLVLAVWGAGAVWWLPQATAASQSDLHPAAASYRRMLFLLDLNPVLWDRVRVEADTIATALERVASADAVTYRAAIAAALDGRSMGEEKGQPEASGERRSRSRRVFALSTEAVAKTLIGYLSRAAGNNLPGREGAVEAARALWSAFAREIAATDRRAYTALEEEWRTLAGATDGERSDEVRAATQAIISYVAANYGAGPGPEPNGRLAPLPMRSPTFDSGAQIPPELPPGHNVDIQLPRPRQFLNMAARGVSESETVLIALGDMAFNSSHIFGEPSRSLGMSCNTCHNKGTTNPNLFIPGLSARPGGMDLSNSFLAPHANNGHFDPLDTPDLRGIRFTSPYGRNGRFPSLREFIRNGILHEFNGPEPDPLVIDAMIAYMNEFDFLPNSQLNRDGSLSEETPTAARRGEVIFRTRFARLSGGSCATCHVPSDHFIDRRRHDIGTVKGSAAGSLDRALDTPTLLGSKHTAPYFHDGSLPTLRAVNEWFNERFDLGLTEAQLGDLTAYLEIVGDGVDPYEHSTDCLQAEFREFEFFLSTYEFLRERDKSGVMEIVFQTIATEIRKHRSLLRDETHLTTMNRLARLMDEAAAACRTGDRETVARGVARYRALYRQNATYLR